jgi:hypothetical protein
MKNINDYTTFINQNISLNQNVKQDNINYDMYKRIINSILKELNINLYFVATFGTSLGVLIPIIEKFSKTGIFEIELNTKNIVLLSLCAIAVLTKENKKHVQALFNLAKTNGIETKSVDRLINQLTNIKVIFSIIAHNFGKVITTFSDMFAYTGLLIPFLHVIDTLIKNESFDTDMLNQSFTSLEVSMGAIALKLLLERILRKVKVLTGESHKIQNKEHADLLRKEDAFKPDYLKTDRLRID